ncbi:MAG: DUF2807 domain-containing protein [Bacteroidales bacterium]|nr:DUF2807 domain-containing protein [Bacteroidales bacterium]
MKMMKWIAALAACSLALAAEAQTTTKTNDFVSFDRIEVASDFEVTFNVSDTYKVNWTYDTILADLVSVFVTGKTLYIDFNKKGMSSELKKTYKGRNAPKMVLKVAVYAPYFSELSLTDNATFEGLGNRFETDAFTVSVSGKAKVANLSVAARKASVEALKDGKVTLTLDAAEVDVRTDNKAAVELVQSSDQLSVTAAGSSNVSLTGNTTDLATNTQNSAKVQMTGTAESLRHEGRGSSEVDLIAAPVKAAEVIMSGSKLYVNVSDELKVDLKSGANVSFSGDPKIGVVNISSSSLMHYTGAKRK